MRAMTLKKFKFQEKKQEPERTAMGKLIDRLLDVLIEENLSGDDTIHCLFAAMYTYGVWDMRSKNCTSTDLKIFAEYKKNLIFHWWDEDEKDLLNKRRLKNEK